MIIPIKCPTCGKVIADLYDYFIRETIKRNIQKGISPTKTEYFSIDNKSAQGELLDELGLDMVCCRRVMLTHVDIK